MRSTPLFLILLTVLFIAGTVSASLQITGPTDIRPFSTFTLNVSLPPTNDFSSAPITIEGKTLATVYPNGSCVVQPDGFGIVSYCSTLDKDTSSNDGLTAILVHTGMDNGTYSATVSAGGNTESFELIVQPSQDEAAIKALKSNAINLEQRLLDAEKTIKEQTDTINGLENQLSSANQDNQSLQSRVNELEQQVGTQGSSIQGLEGKTTAIQKDVDKTIKNPFAPNDEGTAPETVTTNTENNGFTGLATGANVPIIGLILLLGIIGAGFYLRTRGGKNKSMNQPNKAFFEGSMDALFKSVPREGIEIRENHPKKWSASDEAGLREDVENNPPEKTKVSFGDLIKHERD